MMTTKLYEEEKDGNARCLVCHHRCLLKKNKVGLCGVRKNVDGKIVSLVFGKAISVYPDQIEKKTVFSLSAGDKSVVFWHCWL